MAIETIAEGATTPETLRQTDRRGMKLWKANRVCDFTEGVSDSFGS